MSPECRRAYDRYVQTQWGDVTDVERLAETLYRAGSRDAIEAMVRFSDMMPQIDRLRMQVERIQRLLESIAPVEKEAVR